MQPAEEILNIEYNIRPMVLRAMNKFPRSKRQAADALGVSKRQLYRYVKLYDIKKDDDTGQFYFEKQNSKLRIA